MAITFNGSTGYYSAGNVYNFPSGTATNSVMTWVRRAAVGARHDLISKEGTGANGYELSCLSSNLVEYGLFDGTNYRVVASTTTTAINTTYHVCGTYDGTSLRLYVNGVVERTTAYATGSINTTNLNFGRRPSSANYLNGQLEDLRIYNRALSADEVLTIYNARGADNIIQGNLLWFPCTGGAVGSAAGNQIDRSDTKLTLTASGTVTFSENIALTKIL